MPAPRPPRPPHSGRPDTAHLWVDLDSGRLTRWVFAGVVLGVLIAIAAASVSEVDPAAPWNHPFHLLAAAPAVLGTVLCAVRLPRLFTRQGMRADAAGIAFVQRPLWWFRGRTLELPWDGIRAIRSDAPVTSTRPDGDPDLGHQRLAVYLYLPPSTPRPTWLELDEALPEPGDEPLMPRVHTSWGTAERDRMLPYLRGQRPDLLGGTAPAAPGAPAAQAPQSPQTTQAPQAPQVPPVVDERLNVRGGRIVQWFAAATASLILLGSTAAIAVRLLEPGAVAAADTSDLVFFGLLAAAALGLAGYTAAATPRLWTVQYVHLHERGVTLAQERLWWSPERIVTVPWKAVSRLDIRHRRRSGTPYPAIGMQLNRRLSARTAPPTWVGRFEETEVIGGRRVLGELLVLDMGMYGPALRLVHMVRNARPDLFGEPGIEPAPPAEAEAVPAPATDPAAATGTGIATASAAAPTAPFHADLRGRRARAWALGFLGCLYLWAGGVFGAMDTARIIERQEYALLVAPLLWAVVVIAATAWSVRCAPRCLTRQSLTVDDRGIHLVQEPMLWSPDRGVSIPWEQILHARSERKDPGRSRSGQVLKLFLTGPGLVTRVPSWCALSEWEESDVPAHPGRPLTRITVRPTARAAETLAHAVHQAKPGLVKPMRRVR
ncbi:hypothetical protein [Nocardiopsis protaetiae]|uniref:hypothetical protein n=1 Tax=Nocardiopsis protaetiae TaxID=3382270 RepID=UPI00387ABC75